MCIYPCTYLANHWIQCGKTRKHCNGFGSGWDMRSIVSRPTLRGLTRFEFSMFCMSRLPIWHLGSGVQHMYSWLNDFVLAMSCGVDMTPPSLRRDRRRLSLTVSQKTKSVYFRENGIGWSCGKLDRTQQPDITPLCSFFMFFIPPQTDSKARVVPIILKTKSWDPSRLSRLSLTFDQKWGQLNLKFVFGSW